MKYNPFAYIHSEKDILKLVQTIIANTKGEGEKAGEDFWVKAEKLYYTALIGYIFYEAPREEKNFATLLDMIDASEVREDDETYMNPIDRLFEALEKKEPTHFAVKQYKNINWLRERQQNLFLYLVVQGLLHLIFRNLEI
ncbi:Protein virD4 [Streptococcus equi subsp. equi]|nr:Protein virD4 [Streptococcus equi subsp. equi]